MNVFKIKYTRFAFVWKSSLICIRSWINNPYFILFTILVLGVVCMNCLISKHISFSTEQRLYLAFCLRIFFSIKQPLRLSNSHVNLPTQNFAGRITFFIKTRSQNGKQPGRCIMRLFIELTRICEITKNLPCSTLSFLLIHV